MNEEVNEVNEVKNRNMQLQTNQIKAMAFDAIVNANKFAAKQEAHAQNWQGIVEECVRLLELENPSSEQLFSKIHFLMKFYKKHSEDEDHIPIDRL